MVDREQEQDWAKGASASQSYDQRASGGSSPAAGQTAGQTDGPAPSNGQICREIYDRLSPHGQLDTRAIHVDVDDGEVTLSGVVRSGQALRLAQEMAETVSGVKVVHNHLIVRGEPQDERPGGSSPLPAD
jgi:osmotically-inducible protein OsmY